jgi:hypothetical protein
MQTTIDQLIEERVRQAVADAISRLRPPAPAARPRCLGAKEAAEYIGLSHHRLAKLRELGKGPRYRKLGVKVVYEVADLDAYVDQLPAFERPRVRS